ncbi:MAG: carboxypeptidase regulatory-like domain-containing protein [Planctomycetes bacterium]|nr:carboxypeptidase regulatory-like domain-containing protein [Planctomycetota bacterium]
MRPRATTSAADGTFAFRGLPDGLYTLFATTQRDGVTWSGKTPRVQPGADQWPIELRNEDPAPPGPERGR